MGLALGPDNLADIGPLFAAGAVGVKLFWGYALHTHKGALLPGSDADFTIVDPNATTTVDAARLYSKQRQTPWQGQTLRGAVRLSVLRGEVIARDGAPVGQPRGRLVRAHHGG